MNKDNNSSVNLIKERVSIVDIASSYTKLIRSGGKYKGLSPFTNEKTPSFYVDPDKNLFYCFSSGKGGDIFTLIEEVEGKSFIETLKMLGDIAGIEIKSYTKKDNVNQKRVDTLYKILEDTMVFFKSSINEKIKKYLNDRGIDDDLINKFSIGFAPSGHLNLYSHLIKKGYKADDIVATGVIGKKDNGYYDRFFNRVMFPIRDENGRVIAFGGRIIDSDKPVSKYINSPETELYNKSKVLYGFYEAKQAIRKNNFSILMEGYTDVILSNKGGYPVSVSSSGTNVTFAQLEMLKRSANSILLAFDSDNAGFTAMCKCAEKAVSRGMKVKTIDLEKGMDPADIVLKDIEKWKQIVRSSEDIVEWFIKKIEGKKDLQGKLKILDENLIPIVSQVSDKTFFDSYISIISKALDIEKDTLVEKCREVKDSSSISDSDNILREKTKNIEKNIHSRERIDLLRTSLRDGLSYLNDLGIELKKELKDRIDEIKEYGMNDLDKFDDSYKIRFEIEFPDLSSEEEKEKIIELVDEVSLILLLEQFEKERLYYMRKIEGEEDIEKNDELKKKLGIIVSRIAQQKK